MRPRIKAAHYREICELAARMDRELRRLTGPHNRADVALTGWGWTVRVTCALERLGPWFMRRGRAHRILNELQAREGRHRLADLIRRRPTPIAWHEWIRATDADAFDVADALGALYYAGQPARVREARRWVEQGFTPEEVRVLARNGGDPLEARKGTAKA